MVIFVARIVPDLSSASITLATDTGSRVVPPWDRDLTSKADAAMGKLLGAEALVRQDGQVRKYQQSSGWARLSEAPAVEEVVPNGAGSAGEEGGVDAEGSRG